MDDAADVADAFFVHAVGGRVGNHDGGQGVAVLLGFGFQIVDVDVAVFVGIDDDDFQTEHGGGGGVGAVGGLGNQADVAVRFALGFLIAADGKHTAVFALRAGVGLEGNRVKTGNGFQAVLHVGQEFAVACGLGFGGVGVDVGEFRPSNRQHFGGSVELHGATAQRNHAAVHRQIAVFEFFQVAQHFVFGVVTVEHGMLQDIVLAQEFGFQTTFDVV